MAHDPDTDVTKTGPDPSRPHLGRPIEVSRGIIETKHFGSCLGGPTLLYLKFLAETPFTDPRWRNGKWTSKTALAEETGRSVKLIRKWVAALEADGLIHVRRGLKGYRITLSKRIWYRHGKPFISRPKLVR